MSRSRSSNPTWPLVYTLLAIGVIVGVVAFGLNPAQVDATQSVQENGVSLAPTAPTATFPADAGSLGAIPDGTALSPLPAYGAAKNVTFQASGLSGSVTAVSVSFNSGGPSHTFRGDIEATLNAPGGSPSHLLFSRTGATTSSSFGSGSDLTGPYNFTDTAAGAHWWAVTVTPTTPGDYRTVGPGFSAVNPPLTSLNTAMASATPNGTWTLTFRDGCSADTGAISAASLTITTGVAAPAQHVVDYNGDGRTDASVVRNTGGGPSGQITWYNCNTNVAEPGCISTSQWGIATDFFVPEDFDGDAKTDIAVWRSGAPGASNFYILQSLTNTLRVDNFGQTGDDPTVVGDYDGDGKADPAVYRAGASAGAQSVWYYRGSVGPNNGVIVFNPWGSNGDFPAPGDYDGDGLNDFVIQRNAGGGQAIFWTFLRTGAISNTIFGTPTDVIVPGDYDGDGSTDIATIRGSGGAIQWFYKPSTAPAEAFRFLGAFGLSASDFPTQGDWDGDGRTDVGVWRPNADPAQCFFYANGSSSGFQQKEWGQNGDYPVGNFNSH